MAEVSINQGELFFIRKNLKKELVKQNIYANTKDIKWNSNIENYAKTIDTVAEVVKPEKMFSTTFLRDFLYKKEEFKNVREKNINVIYRFLYNSDRATFFEKYNISFDNKQYYFYSVKPFNKKQQDKIIEDTHLLLKFRLFGDEQDSIIISQYKSLSTGVCFYIDSHFLKKYRPVKFLLTLFTEAFISLITTYHVKFIFDEDLFDASTESNENLYSHKGRMSFFKYWKEKKIPNFSPKEPWFENKFKTEKPFLIILERIKRFSEENNIQRMLSIDRFLPLLVDLNSLQPKKLKNIYEESENLDNGNDFTFLGVIGYNGFFHGKEKREMLRYFYYYGDSLRKGNLIRIFTIPAKRVKNKGWSSQFTEEINHLLYQYIYINLRAGVETYLLAYDEDQIGEKSDIMWNQDYVLRIHKSDKFDKKSINGVGESLFMTHMLREEVEYQKDTKLYFAYPENESGENQMIDISSFKEEANASIPNNQLYIRHVYQDFLNRLSLLKIEKKYANLQRIKKGDMQFVKNILNMNTLGINLFKTLEYEVDIFYDEV